MLYVKPWAPLHCNLFSWSRCDQMRQKGTNPSTVGQSLAHYFPENAIVVDEGGTCGGGSAMATAAAPAHDWLMLTGGSIGYGCPQPRVLLWLVLIGVSLISRQMAVPSATVQALWTQEESLDITTIILPIASTLFYRLSSPGLGHNPDLRR